MDKLPSVARNEMCMTLKLKRLIYSMKKVIYFIFFCTTVYSCGKNNEEKRLSINGQKYQGSQLSKRCVNDTVLHENLFKDSLEIFSINFSDNWDVEVVFDDKIKGIYAMDTSYYLRTENLTTIVINKVVSSEPLSSFFISELKGLEDEEMEIIKIGDYRIDNYLAKWVMTSRSLDEFETFDVIIYTKGPYNSEVFLVQITLSSTNDIDQQVCSAVSVINSLKFLPKKQLFRSSI